MGDGIAGASARLIRLDENNTLRRQASSPAALMMGGIVSLLAWGLLAWRSHQGGFPLGWMLVTMVVTWTALAGAMKGISRQRSRNMLVFAFGFRLVAFLARPVMEDDHHRFLWDGYRFTATGNPYAEAPQARFGDDAIPEEFRRVLDRINHPDVPTVYGPLTQWAFRFSYGVAPAQLWPWKLIVMAAEAAIVALLWPVLSRRGQLLLAWCPLTVFEAGFNAHPDLLAIAGIVGAWWFGRKSLAYAAGATAGLAIAAKVFAVLVVPFVLWRQGRRSWAAAALVVVVFYAPFWWRGSTADLAGLQAMAVGWEFNSSIFALVSALSSRSVAQLACALAFALVWIALLMRWARLRSPSSDLPPGEAIYGAFLLLSATANPWYCLWLLPFVAARPSLAGACALGAVSLAYVTGLNLNDTSLGNFEHPAWLRPLEFGIIGLAAWWSFRSRKTRP